MHGLLTLSALHIASSCEMDREGYLEMAQRHRKEIAVPVSECPDLEHSPDATFALSAIVMMFSFGFSRVAEPMVSSLDSFVQIFQSVRDSIGAPLDTVDGTQEGRLGPFTSLESSTPCMPDTSQLAIHSLQTLNATLGDRDARHREVYDTTIQHLSFSFQKFFSGSDVAIAAFLWISRVPSQFMALLHERQPLALVILAHFAVIIHPLRRQWWMREWSTSIVREIGQVLGGEWRPSIRWVMDATGCYIPPCNES